VQTVERTPPQRAAPPAPAPERTPPQFAERTPPPTRTLDAAEVDVLVKQGQQFVAAGDFVTARLVFQRAAEAGNAAAALALGASYDPVVLSRLGVRGVDADVGKARAWYQKAKEFGAPDADRRLSTLANR
jgi:TPR repeat protein